MDEEATSGVLLLMLTASVLSMAALAYLFQKHVSGESLLAYQPRRRVPWGPLVALLAMAMPLLGVASFFLSSEPTVTEEASTESLLLVGWGNFTFMVLFVVGGAACLVTFLHADSHDLGLPTSWRQLFHDVSLGLFATVAAMLPIYAVQLTLIATFESKTQHPLVQQLSQHNSPEMLLLGFAMAVIAAPLFEEFIFRGLLQGWLERREDEVLGFPSTERPESIDSEIEGAGPRIRVPVTADVTPLSPTSDINLGDDTAWKVASECSPPVHAPASELPRPSHGWIRDLPHGWTPILLSGTAFGLAHLGHGVAPISLILFGIVLGYLYQRTHRLVPSITAHMLFNSYSMVLLWLQLEGPAAN